MRDNLLLTKTRHHQASPSERRQKGPPCLRSPCCMFSCCYLKVSTTSPRWHTARKPRDLVGASECCFCIPGMLTSFRSVAGVAWLLQEWAAHSASPEEMSAQSWQDLLFGDWAPFLLTPSCHESGTYATHEQYLFSIFGSGHSASLWKLWLLPGQTLWAPREVRNGTGSAWGSWQGFLGCCGPVLAESHFTERPS